MALFTTDLGIKPLLTERFSYALQCATTWHQHQLRKGDTPVPYISHLLAVCSLVLEAGGNEDEAIAALLHDSVEDVLDRIKDEELAISAHFGQKVLDIVLELSEDKPLPKTQRKVNYVKSILTMSESALKISIADKLHNLRCYSINSELINKEVMAFYAFLIPNYQRRLVDIHNWALSRQVLEMESIYLRLSGAE